jgi:DNA modification methylase
MIKYLEGNCIDKIKELEDNSIDCVVSSPPYFGLRNYGVDGQFGLEKTYQDYLANTVKVFETFKPKLKDTATIWWNVGDSYNQNQSAGDRVSKYSKKQKTNQGNLGFKIESQKNLKVKDLLMIPNRVAIALQESGWYIRSEIIWHKPNPMPESIKDRPTSAHEKIWLITKNKKYYYDSDAIREPVAESTITRLSEKNLKNQKGSTRGNGGMKSNGNMKPVGNMETKNKRNVWTITTKPCKEAHFATFPKDLIEPCIKAGCPEGGVVLDPFGGAGTTGIVAQSLNRQAILIELNPEYIEISKNRIDKEFGMFK